MQKSTDNYHHYYLYSALLVAVEESITMSSKTDQQQKEEEDIENLQLIKDTRKTFEQRRRSYGNIILTDPDEMDPTNSDSDIDSPYISDEESMSYCDESQTDKKNHGSGPVKLYLKERFSDLPKSGYEKYRKHHLGKHGIQMNYGSVHTKEIRCSLKNETIQRQKDEISCSHIKNMMENLPRSTSFLSLDPLNPVQPIPEYRTPVSPIGTNTQKHIKSLRRLHRIKVKFKQTLQRTINDPNHLTIVKEQMTSISDTNNDEELNNTYDKF
jgi:hypothetical protein